MQYSCVLAVLQILLTNKGEIIEKHKNREMIDQYASELDKILHILKTSYDKSLC